MENISIFIDLLNKVHIQPEITEMFGKCLIIDLHMFCCVKCISCLSLSLVMKSINSVKTEPNFAPLQVFIACGKYYRVAMRSVRV